MVSGQGRRADPERSTRGAVDLRARLRRAPGYRDALSTVAVAVASSPGAVEWLRRAVAGGGNAAESASVATLPASVHAQGDRGP